MNNIYVITCITWGGSYYLTEDVEAFHSAEKAHEHCAIYQGKQKKCDIEYCVKSVPIGDSVGD